MKKVILLFLLLAVAASTFSQQINPSPVLTKQDYQLKSKRQKTAAWVLMGGGFVMSTIGISLALNDATVILISVLTLTPTNDNNNSSAAELLLITGAASMLGSIPLFIAAGKNKRKAMSLSFKNEKMQLLYKTSFVFRDIPSLNIKLEL